MEHISIREEEQEEHVDNCLLNDIAVITCQSFFFVESLLSVATSALTLESNNVPIITSTNPHNHMVENSSSHSKNPRIEDTAKLAAFDMAVPATLPLSSIPSKKLPTMLMFKSRFPTKQSPRTVQTRTWQCGKAKYELHLSSVYRVRNVSEEKANLAKQDAMAPNAPLRRAKGGTDDMSLFSDTKKISVANVKCKGSDL